MKKLLTLIVKNTIGHKQFFPPLNRTVGPGGKIDVLRMCESDSALAEKVAAPYRKVPGWEIFEVFASLPSPEGVLQEAAVVSAPMTLPGPETKEGAPEAKKKFMPKKPEVEVAPTAKE